MTEPTTSTPLTVLSTTRERGINADKKRVDLDVCLCGRRQRVLNSCDTVSCRKVSLFSSVVCVSSRAIISNSFVSVALRRVNAGNTERLISVTSAFSTAFTSVSWVRAAWLCDSAAVSSLPKRVTNVAFSSIS